MVELNWTDKARFWLRSVFDYIFEDNPDAALNVVTSIYDKTQLLSDHPRLGQR